MPPGSSYRIRLDGGSGAGEPDPAAARSFRRRRRNRHGRGLRGELLPAHLAGSRTRAERFDDWVMESAQRLERLWGEDIQSYQFVVQEIPDGLEDLVRRGGNVPLAASAPGNGPKPPVITIYRRPVESTARGLVPVNELIHDVVVEQLASLMGLDPELIDPTYGRFRPL
ncbi:metallopeptidase family protein [Arthrobacter sp. BL-252-APC-1A]|uniref:metallopeptidase family protein n=1 Tax=Arthrobacter sp. BL-252-APC-1A TaxID=2606622 RepID=UPI0012B22796|nr:metallopeptidase family protein [Arthrobacter sp. BL-252-APC-1A]MSR98240.1 metallopeptidase family protein [Arthrobacter sp. BL-252-APC-1A]